MLSNTWHQISAILFLSVNFFEQCFLTKLLLYITQMCYIWVSLVPTVSIYIFLRLVAGIVDVVGIRLICLN